MTSPSTRVDSDARRPVMGSTLDPSMGDSEVSAASAPGVSDASQPGTGDESPEYSADSSGAERRCEWCRKLLTKTQDKWCSKRCRQTAWRFRRLAVVEDLGDTPKRLVYADPPFPGMSRKYYGDQPSYGGEVDHARLLEELVTYDGWALSTSAKSLGLVLSLVHRGVEYRVCSWTKTHHPPMARGPANIWEPLIVSPARRRMPGVPDALVTSVARGGDSSLIGRKPLAFVSWLFQLLGATHRDSLDDRFPGSEVVGRCWSEFRRLGTAATRRSAPAESRRQSTRETGLLALGGAR